MNKNYIELMIIVLSFLNKYINSTYILFLEKIILNYFSDNDFKCLITI